MFLAVAEILQAWHDPKCVVSADALLMCEQIDNALQALAKGDWESWYTLPGSIRTTIENSKVDAATAAAKIGTIAHSARLTTDQIQHWAERAEQLVTITHTPDTISNLLAWLDTAGRHEYAAAIKRIGTHTDT